MSTGVRPLETLVRRALSGKGAHVETISVFSALDWKAASAKPRGVPHSAFQVLQHMNFWQDWVVRWLNGQKPSLLSHASGSWPAEAGPSSAREWEAGVRLFRRRLAELERACRDADLSAGRSQKSRFEMLQTIAAHNSYHAGQVVFLRRLLGKWPPPSGGLTW